MWALLVNSYVENQQAIEKLLDSCCDSDWNGEPILVVIGGSRKPYSISKATHKRIEYFQVYAPHNSIDYTAMITLIEFDDPKLVFDAYMYIHDTCTVQPAFFQTIEKFYKNLTCESSAPVSEFPCMNMGLYPRELIFVNHFFLKKRRTNDDWTTEEVKQKKIEAVVLEDLIFLHQPIKHFMSEKVKVGPMDVYGHGNNRFVQTFPGAQLNKFQANWTKKTEYVMDL